MSYSHQTSTVTHAVGGTALTEHVPLSSEEAAIVESLANCQTWYNQKTADLLALLKRTTDVFGNSLLDHTIVPYVTEVPDLNHGRAPHAALIFGGRALGMRGGQFLEFPAGNRRSHNDLWLTIAQAYLRTADPLPLLAHEPFVQTDVAPIAGLWSPPA